MLIGVAIDILDYFIMYYKPEWYIVFSFVIDWVKYGHSYVLYISYYHSLLVFPYGIGTASGGVGSV